MFAPVTIDEAKRSVWDVIIAGSSFASMFFLRGLSPDLRVLIVEKGPLQPHAHQVENYIIGKEDFAQTNHSGHEKEWTAHSLFGGNSNCWWACTPRFMPSDFELNTRYGIGQDWPFGYDALAPYYQQVEEIMEIAGGGSDHLLPRDYPFPYPPHKGTISDRLLQSQSNMWFAQPTARANGGTRATCCANGVCSRCPIDAKFTILNGMAHFERQNVRILGNAEARACRIEGGRATGLAVRVDGADHEIGASKIALATNPVFNTAILLRSGVTHPLLGTGVHEQASQYVHVDAPDLGLYGATSITGHGYGAYDGAWRATSAAVLIEVHNIPFKPRPEINRWTDRMRLKLIAEDLPQTRNRITLRDDAPHIEWHGYSDYAEAGLTRAFDALPDLLPFEAEAITRDNRDATEAHILGGHVMGLDPARSVTRPDLQLHDVEGLFALGAGNFPASAPANPSLTISALSLMAAESLR